MRVGRFGNFAIAVVLGSALTALMVWLFGIRIADAEMFKTFPDGWHIMDLVGNVLVVLMFFGSIRVIDRAMWQEMGGGRQRREEECDARCGLYLAFSCDGVICCVKSTRESVYPENCSCLATSGLWPVFD